MDKVLEENEQDEQDLFEHFRLSVDKGQDLLRIDKFLMNRVENATRTKIQQAAVSGNILVNGHTVKPSYKVKPGDVITLVLPHPPREIELKPEFIPLEIVFEDDELVVINKQAGLVVHPGYGNYTGTLVNGLLYHFQHLPLYQEKNPRPGLVHRLDKDTTGIMVLAKTENSLARLARQFFDRSIERSYWALVWGNVAADEGRIEGNVGRNIRDRKQMQVFPEGEQGKPAFTRFKVLKRFGYVTLVECKLETGRTHQIRVHFKYIGHPLFCDELYGGRAILKGTSFNKYKQFVENCFNLLNRQALHAKSLGFIHPVTGQNHFFNSDLPKDLDEVLKKWENYSELSKISE